MADVRDGAPFGSRSAGIFLVVAVALSAAPVRAESRPAGRSGLRSGRPATIAPIRSLANANTNRSPMASKRPATSRPASRRTSGSTERRRPDDATLPQPVEIAGKTAVD
jgi:hypothetical protein